MKEKKFGRCLSCVHFDRHRGYCSYRDCDTVAAAGCTDHETLSEYQQRQKEYEETETLL